MRGQRRRHADDDRVRVREPVEIAWWLETVRRRHASSIARVGDVPDVALAGLSCDLARVDVEAEDREAGRPRGQRERQADIAEPDDADDRGLSRYARCGWGLAVIRGCCEALM